MARRNGTLSTISRPSQLTLVVAIFALVLATMPSTAFGAPSMKQFAGTTSQTTLTASFHITMNVDATRVSDLEFGAQALKGPSACTLNSQDGSSFVFSTGALVIANHRIAGKLKDDLGDTVVVHGHVSRGSVTGTFIVFAPGVTAGAETCNSGIVTFVAQSGIAPPRGTAYTGTIGPGYLITFDVSPHGTTVDNLVVAYDETCNGSPSDVAPTFRFKSLVITTGEFTGTTTGTFGATVSDTVHIEGTFSGGVAAGQVSDTSRITGFPTCTQTSPFVATAT